MIAESGQPVVDDRRRSDHQADVADKIFDIPSTEDIVQGCSQGFRRPWRHEQHGAALQGDVEACVGFPAGAPGMPADPQAVEDSKQRNDDECGHHCRKRPLCCDQTGGLLGSGRRSRSFGRARIDATYSVTVSSWIRPNRTSKSTGFNRRYFAALIKLSAVTSLFSRTAL